MCSFRIENPKSLLKNLKVKFGNLTNETCHKLWIVRGFKDLSEKGVSVPAGTKLLKNFTQYLEELSRWKVTWRNRFPVYEIIFLFLEKMLEERHICKEKKLIFGLRLWRSHPQFYVGEMRMQTMRLNPSVHVKVRL